VAHVNRVLRSLRDERIVQLEKHCVTILDFERLTRLTLSGGIASSVAGLGERYSEEPAPHGGQRARMGPNFDQLSLRLAAVHGASVTWWRVARTASRSAATMALPGAGRR